MTDQSTTFSLPKDLVEGALKQHIALALSQAMSDEGGTNKLVDKMINEALYKKVKKTNGSTDISSYDERSKNVTTWVEFAVSKIIREQFLKMLHQELSAMEKPIKEMLTKELTKSRSPLLKMLVKSMAEGMINTSRFGLKMDISVKQQD